MTFFFYNKLFRGMSPVVTFGFTSYVYPRPLWLQ